MSVQYGMPVRCLSRGSALVVRRRGAAAAVASRTASDQPNPDNQYQNTPNSSLAFTILREQLKTIICLFICKAMRRNTTNTMTFWLRGVPRTLTMQHGNSFA